MGFMGLNIVQNQNCEQILCDKICKRKKQNGTVPKNLVLKKATQDGVSYIALEKLSHIGLRGVFNGKVSTYNMRVSTHYCICRLTLS
jgi:hypothetical protein